MVQLCSVVRPICFKSPKKEKKKNILVKCGDSALGLRAQVTLSHPMSACLFSVFLFPWTVFNHKFTCQTHIEHRTISCYLFTGWAKLQRYFRELPSCSGRLAFCKTSVWLCCFASFPLYNVRCCSGYYETLEPRKNFQLCFAVARL